MDDRAKRLLCCAVNFRENSPSAIPMETNHNSIDNAVESMIRVLQFEASKAFQEPISMPDNPFLHPVDIETSNPGIVTKKGKNDIERRPTPLPKVQYKRRNIQKVVYEVPSPKEDISIEEAIQKSRKETIKDLEKQEKTANREIKQDENTQMKIENRERNKRERMEETPEQREERLQALRSKRAAAKAERDTKKQNELEEQAKDALLKRNDGDNVNDADGEDEDNKSEENDGNVCKDVPPQVITNFEELLELDGECTERLPSMLPNKLKIRERKAKFYASAVPHDRHLSALEMTCPDKVFDDALLYNKKSEALQLLHGPPGTGKTTALLHKVAQSKASRIFLCAPSNVGAANLNTRALAMGLECALVMPTSKIPIGTPVISSNPQCRIVCATISMRAGMILDSQDFDEIYVDEAAQCLEPWIWGLLRPKVAKLVMAGDIHQLPALVSEQVQTLGYDKSLMQRLMEHKYPHEFLKVQRRMHPEILQFVNQKYYHGRLESDYVTPSPPVTLAPYVVKHCDSQEESNGTSFLNKQEATDAIRYASYLQDKFENVVILTPYQSQSRELLSKTSKIPIHTIDSFQGREADAIVLSMVRTHDMGFWSDQRRIVVALTRARHHMCIIGNTKRWSGELQEIVKDAQTRKCLQ